MLLDETVGTCPKFQGKSQNHLICKHNAQALQTVGNKVIDSIKRLDGADCAGYLSGVEVPSHWSLHVRICHRLH